MDRAESLPMFERQVQQLRGTLSSRSGRRRTGMRVEIFPDHDDSSRRDGDDQAQD